MAEIIEPMVHQENNRDILDNNNPDPGGYSLDPGDTAPVRSDSLQDSSVSVSEKLFTDKRFAKDIIKQAQKEGLGLTGPGGLFNSVNENPPRNRPGSGNGRPSRI